MQKVENVLNAIIHADFRRCTLSGDSPATQIVLVPLSRLAAH